jgi:transcriptional regulator with XRE-family HTH domain
MTLLEYLNSRGITQKAFAKDVNITKQYAYSIFHGKIRIGRNIATRISEAYGIPINEIIIDEIKISNQESNYKKDTFCSSETSFIDFLKTEKERLEKKVDELNSAIFNLTGHVRLLEEKEKQIEELKRELKEERDKFMQLKNTEYETKTESKQGGGTRKTTHGKPSAGGARK